MSAFQELNDYVNKTMTYILENDNICNLIAYNDSTPLSHDPLSQEDRLNLISKKIYPFNYIPNEDQLKEQEKTIISIILEDFSNDGNLYFKKGYITINVLCHNNLWRTDSGYRPFLIMEELEKSFNKIHNKENTIGIGGTYFQSANYLWANYNYSGYTVRYKASSMS